MNRAVSRQRGGGAIKSSRLFSLLSPRFSGRTSWVTSVVIQTRRLRDVLGVFVYSSSDIERVSRIENLKPSVHSARRENGVAHGPKRVNSHRTTPVEDSQSCARSDYVLSVNGVQKAFCVLRQATAVTSKCSRRYDSLIHVYVGWTRRRHGRRP